MGRDLSTPVPTQLPLSKRSIAWEVNAEPATVFVGGGRALLMQVAHPSVGAGVEQHSSYARDPWGRLFRTLDIMMKLSFGTPEVSERQARVLHNMHRRVTGTTDTGERYHALDTGLQLWVWATLVDTAAAVYSKVRRPLSIAETERFYQESKLVAYGCGVPHAACPDAWSDFQAYVQQVVRDDLHVTRSALSVATAAMVPPLPGRLGPAAGVPTELFTVGMLPPSLREPFGFEWNAARQRRFDALITAMRVSSRLTPAPVRHVGATVTVNRKRALRVPWLQKRGGELTQQRLRAAGLS